jgi:glycosyltransferase
MKNVRVLHAVPKMNREGIQSFLMNVYRNIDREKVQFDFLIHSKEKGAFDDEIISLGGRIFYLNKLSSKYFLSYQKNLVRFFKEHEYNIIHSHINLLSSFTLSSAKKANIPIRIAHSHSSSISDIGLRKLIKLFAKTQMNKYATHKFACSKEAGIWQFGKKIWNTGEVKVIPNGIEVEKFLFNEINREKVRKQYDIEEKAFVLGHVGAFRKVKNHEFLLKIFEKIKKLNSSAILMLLGSGELETEIKELASRLDVLSSIVFVGSVGNVAEYYSAFDSFVFPSIYEGLGIVLIEAQANGLPCFASDVVPSEVALSDVYFPLSLNASVEEWATSIINKSNLSNRQCSEGLKKYDIKNVAKTLEDFYLSV